MQLIRWIGFVRYGIADLAELRDCGVLSDEDYDAIRPADEFLLRLRNELHFHAGEADDVLDRAEQLRLAERCGLSRSDRPAAGRAVHARLFPPHQPVSHVPPRSWPRPRPVPGSTSR